MIDPRYTKFLVLVQSYRGAEDEIVPIDYHKCSETELRQLAKPTKDTEPMLEALIDSEDRSLFCIDWDDYGDKLALYGSPQSQNYATISIILAPCNFMFPGLEDFYPISDECIRNETA